MSGSLPLILTAAGAAPTSPSVLNATLIAQATLLDPTITTDLPGSLIEDLSSTGTGALIVSDQARVNAVNSVTPLGANPFILAALGQQFGVPQGTPSNASAEVLFTGSNGYEIPAGFTVSDGTNQYVVQAPGGVVGSGNYVSVVATNSGTFAIPANTITQVITSVAATYTVNVNNPNAGINATAAETVPSYRSRVLLAGQVTSTGVPAYLKTLLYAITGVQQQLVSISQQSGGGYEVICGGGNNYAVATAILQAIPDFTTLKGSQLAITAMTNANPVVITTNLNHNFIAGNTFVVAGASPSAFNLTYTAASVTATTITTTTNGSGFGAYTSGAYLNPNPRNITVSIFQNPNTYSITYVNPPQQIVTVTCVWNTTLSSFTAGVSVNQLGAVAIQTYINSITVGQPINLLEMTALFQEAVAPVIATPNLTTLTFAVTINGVATSPSAGTSIISSDPESYFYAALTGISVTQ